MTKRTVKKELSIEEMSKLYDRIYDITDRLLKKHNPCDIKKRQRFKSGSKHFTCLGTRSESMCCGICVHWDKGCTVQCIACKLFLCDTVECKYRLLYKQLQRLKKILTNYAKLYTKTINEKGVYYDFVYRYFIPKEDYLKWLTQIRKSQIKRKQSKRKTKV